VHEIKEDMAILYLGILAISVVCKFAYGTAMPWEFADINGVHLCHTGSNGSCSVCSPLELTMGNPKPCCLSSKIRKSSVSFLDAWKANFMHQLWIIWLIDVAVGETDFLRNISHNIEMFLYVIQSLHVLA